MQTWEKEELRELKKEVVQKLKALRINYPRLRRVDDRLANYAMELRKYPEKHNLYELLALLRFFSMMERYELRANEVQKFVQTYEFLRFRGAEGAMRYRLTPIQVFQFTNMLGFYDAEGYRVITEALLFVPRKFSKTTQVASLAVYDLLFGDANAESYVAANSYTQAQICFKEIQFILKHLDNKLKRFKINREQVFNLSKGKSSFARCLAANPDKLDGLNASLVILDEYSQSETADLKNVLTSSMGNRRNPLTVVITTASDKKETPFYEMLESYKAILRGEMHNDNIFAHLFEPDVDDEEGDPATWYKVQPHLGITVQERYYRDQWAKAQNSSANMQEFRNKFLNIFAKDERREWITRRQIESLSLQTKPEQWNGVPCVCTVDLSVRDDFSAITYLFYSPLRVVNGVSAPFHSITEYYIPEGILSTHPNRELYLRWIEQGYLKTCRGAVIDYTQLANDILGRRWLIRGIGFDPYKSKDFQKIIECAPNAGKDYLYPIGQTYGNFTSPVEAMEIAVATGRITFEDNPITAYCFDNAVIDEDRMENRKPIKAEPNLKIDGCITNVMGFWMMNNVRTG